MNADMKESLALIGVDKGISLEDFLVQYKLFIDKIETPNER